MDELADHCGEYTNQYNNTQSNYCNACKLINPYDTPEPDIFLEPADYITKHEPPWNRTNKNTGNKQEMYKLRPDITIDMNPRKEGNKNEYR